MCAFASLLVGTRVDSHVLYTYTPPSDGTDHPLYEVDTAFDLVTERKAIPDGALAFARRVMILRGGDDNIVSPERACEEWTR